MLETLDSAAGDAPSAAGDAPSAAGILLLDEVPTMTRRSVPEVDTSAPFESVKEAVDHFGGSAVWKLQLKPLFHTEKHHCFEELELMTPEEQTSKLEMDLIVKERETLIVLKELEITKRIVDGLKMKLRKEPSDVIKIPGMSSDLKVQPTLDTEEQQTRNPDDHVESVGPSINAKQSPQLILMELKQAKLNLNRTTNDLASIRASIELLNSKIKGDKFLHRKTLERLSSNTAKTSSLEEELNITSMELQRTKDMKCKGYGSCPDILEQIRQLNSQKEQFKMITKAAESEISKLTTEIKETKVSMKTVEIRCLAAKRVEEAAKTAEIIALSKIKAPTNSENSAVCQDSSKIILSIEEYAVLSQKAQEADELSKKKIEDAMIQVEAAKRSKKHLILKVEEATTDVEISKKALEEALNREEAANREKLAFEAALRKWRSEHGQKRRPTQNSTKFKNSCTTPHRRDSRMLDVNGLSLSTSGSSPLGPTLSIGQILSRKLTGPEEYEATRETVSGKPKVSLGQILSRRHHGGLCHQSTDDGIGHKQLSAKRLFTFTGFSLQFAGQNKKSKKKKRQTWNHQLNCKPRL